MRLIRLAQYFFWGSLSNWALRAYMHAGREALADEWQRLHFDFIKLAHIARLKYERGENWQTPENSVNEDTEEHAAES